MNGTTMYKPRSLWQNTLWKQSNIAQRYLLVFFLRDEEFVSKTINKGSVDLDKFLASKMHHLAKKMERSKVTARHIKQVSRDPKAVQINLTQHQHTELSHRKHKKRKQMIKPKQFHHKNVEHPQSCQYKKSFDPKLAHKSKDRCNKCGDSAHLEVFQCPMKRFQCKSCHQFGHYASLCYQKIQQKQAPYKSRKPKAHQLKAGTIYVQDSTICGQSEDSSSDDSFCLQIKV